MSATVFWPAALGLIVLALGLTMYRRDVVESMSFAEPIRALGPVFIAAAIATFSGEHFTDAASLVRLVPQWLPLRIPITYLVGMSLLAAGLSIGARVAVRWSAPSLALLFALFVLLIYAPSAARHPRLHIVWIFPFREGTFAVAAFSIFVLSTRPTWSGGFAQFARLWAAFVVTFYGVLHLRYPEFAPGVPSEVRTAAWVPFPLAVAYVTGVVLVALGVSAAFKKTAVSAMTSVGVFMTALTIVLYGPDLFLAHGAKQQVTAINFVADTLLFAGSMFAIASAVGVNRRALTDSPRRVNGPVAVGAPMTEPRFEQGPISRLLSRPS